MKSRHSYFLRTFKCPCCGQARTAPKKRETAQNHIKHMYCSNCKEFMAFKQVGADRVKGV